MRRGSSREATVVSGLTKMLALKAADAVVEQKGALPPMHLHIKGA